MCAGTEPALTGAFLELLEATARHAADHPVGTAVVRRPARARTHVRLPQLHVMLEAARFKSPAGRYVVRAEGPGSLLRGVGFESMREVQVVSGWEQDVPDGGGVA